MLHNVPDWATRHGYWHHSNPRSKDRAKTLYEKVHVRPQIEKAFETLRDKNATDADKLLAKGVLHRLYDRRSSANMEAGKATQTACDLHLVMDERGEVLNLADATHAAVEQLQSYKPKNDEDAARLDKYLEELPLVIEHATKGLQEAMASENRILGEKQLLGMMPGLAVPHDTRPDYANRGDLKTKWSRPSTRSKSGWQSASLPNSLTGMFDMNNVYQAAGFWALNGHRPPFLLYANATDYRLFTPENAPELRSDFLQDVVNDIILQHKTTENILRAASTKDELLGLVSPDWQNICWSETDTYLEEAKKMWGV